MVITDKHNGRTDKLRAARHAYVADRYAGWFDFAPIAALTGRDIEALPPTEANGAFNGYNPDFVYRYRKLPELKLSEMITLSDW